MTVAELIEQLKQMPQDAVVERGNWQDDPILEEYELEYEEIISVELIAGKVQIL